VTQPKFQPGEVVATPGCLTALAEAGQVPHEFVSRHLAGDWGEVDEEDAILNDAAVRASAPVRVRQPARFTA
jgi:hypothetical protein